MRYILVVLSIFLLEGCTQLIPPVTEYKIATKELSVKTSSTMCRERSLKIAQAFSSNSLMSLQMNYIEGSSKIYAYTQSQWITAPNKEITSRIIKAIRDSKLFKTVQSTKSRSNSELILETTIDDFMQYYNKDLTTSYVDVIVTMTLIDTKTNLVVATKTLKATKDVQTLDAMGGVDGLSAALGDVMNQSIEFLDEVCR